MDCIFLAALQHVRNVFVGAKALQSSDILCDYVCIIIIKKYMTAERLAATEEESMSGIAFGRGWPSAAMHPSPINDGLGAAFTAANMHLWAGSSRAG